MTRRSISDMKLFLLVITLLFSLALAADEIRIVSLSPSLTELICVLGGESKLVGRSTACNYPETVRKITAAGDFAKPNVEMIAALRPTVIVADSLYPPAAGEMLRKLGFRLIVKPNTTLNEYLQWVTFLGRELRMETAAETECARVKQQRAALLKNNGKIPENKRPRIVWLLWHDPLLAAGGGSLCDEVIHLSGGVNPAGKEKAYFRPSVEWLLQTDPDILILLHGQGNAAGLLRKHPALKNIKAVKNNRIITDLPEDLLLRPGPRLFEGIRLLMKAAAE